MSFETPTSLITQIQTQLRSQANLHSFNPNDSSLPPLPSLQSILESINPSPPYLRCKHCKGKLLRGLESIICVYCGEFREMLPEPEPIKFRDTFGCRGMLKALNVDGTVRNDSVGISDNAKGAKNDPAFTDLFDVELKWSAMPKKTEIRNASNTPVQNKSSLNVVGVDLDNFFSDSKKDDFFPESKKDVPVVATEQFMPDIQFPSAENSAFNGQGSLGLFENAQSSELGLPTKSAEVLVSDPFASWETQIQPVSCEALPVTTSSFDLFASSSFESGVNINEESYGKLQSPPVTNNKVRQDDLWATTSQKLSVSDIVNEDDDSFDAWQEFTTSGKTTDPFSSSGNTMEMCMTDERTSEMNMPSVTKNLQEVEVGNFTQQHNLFPGEDIILGVDMFPDSHTYGDGMKDASISNRDEVNTVSDTQGTGNILENIDLTMLSEPVDLTVESLMAQMHDLSFMLESNLSIPKKEDEFDSINRN